jgi:hypothetical protein
VQVHVHAPDMVPEFEAVMGSLEQHRNDAESRMLDEVSLLLSLRVVVSVSLLVGMRQAIGAMAGGHRVGKSPYCSKQHHCEEP